MRHRSLGVTALAFGAVMVAIYGQYAAIALLMTGSVFTAAGSLHAAFTLMTGAIFLGLTATAYMVGFGLWTHKHWAWAGGAVVFTVFIVTNLLLSVLATNYLSALLPTVGAVVALWYLQRPAVRAELLGTAVRAEAHAPMSDALKGAAPIH